MTTTKVEVMTLAEVETMARNGIRKHDENDLQTGEAFKYIREKRMYVAGYGSRGFGKYLKAEFDVTESYATTLIHAYETYLEHELELVDCALSTDSLIQLPRLKDKAKISRAIKIATRHSKMPTLAVVRKAVNEVLGIPTMGQPESEPEQEHETEAKPKKDYYTPENFRTNVHKLLDKLTESWAESIGMETMQKIIIDELFKVKANKAA